MSTSAEKVIGYARDAGCVLVGLGGITYQIVTGRTSVELLAVCMALLGITGVINVPRLRPPRSSSGGRGRSSRASSSGSRSRSSPPARDDDPL